MRPRWLGNRGGGRHARGARMLAGHTIWVVSAAMAIICGIVVMTPTGGAVRLATRMADAMGTSPRQAPDAPPTPTDGRSFNGTPAVGALFTVSGGQLGRHFCTASVVDSPPGDLVITAAHCVSGMAAGQIAFVPGYRSGVAPYGPFLGRVDPSTGDGTVIGVIGGYEQGGDIASVSYSPGFGRAVQALYQIAITRG
jgi:Trypsin